MSKTIELPDDVYERIAAEASATGTTPTEWIAAQVANDTASAAATRMETNGDATGVVNVALSEAVYERLTETAAASGVTPEAWISGRLPSPAPVYITSKGEPARTLADMMEGLIGTYSSSSAEEGVAQPEIDAGDGTSPKTLADRMAGYIGRLSSERGDLSSRHRELFLEGLLEKKRTGHL